MDKINQKTTREAYKTTGEAYKTTGEATKRPLKLPISCIITHLTLWTLSSAITSYSTIAKHPVPDVHSRGSWEHLYDVSSHLDRVMWVKTSFYTLSGPKITEIADIMKNLTWTLSSSDTKHSRTINYPVQDFCNRTPLKHLCDILAHLDQDKYFKTWISYTLSILILHCWEPTTSKTKNWNYTHCDALLPPVYRNISTILILEHFFLDTDPLYSSNICDIKL